MHLPKSCNAYKAPQRTFVRCVEKYGIGLNSLYLGTRPDCTQRRVRSQKWQKSSPVSWASTGLSCAGIIFFSYCESIAWTGPCQWWSAFTGSSPLFLSCKGCSLRSFNSRLRISMDWRSQRYGRITGAEIEQWLEILNEVWAERESWKELAEDDEKIGAFVGKLVQVTN